jgi:hypothetical protein
MDLAKRMMGAGVVALDLIFPSGAYAQQGRIPGYLLEYSREKGIPMVETGELKMNVENRSIKVTFVPFNEAVRQMQRLAEKNYVEEAWGCVPDESMCVETGFGGESSQEIRQRRDLMKKMIENSKGKVVFAHTHLLRHNDKSPYASLIPSKRDIIDPIFVSYPQAPKNFELMVVSPLGYTSWTYDFQRLGDFNRIREEYFLSIFGKADEPHLRLSFGKAQELEILRDHDSCLLKEGVSGKNAGKIREFASFKDVIGFSECMNGKGMVKINYRELKR